MNNGLWSRVAEKLRKLLELSAQDRRARLESLADEDPVEAQEHAGAIARLLETTDPDNAEFGRVHLVLGDVAGMHGDGQRARGHWQTAHEAATGRLDPDHPLAAARRLAGD